MPQIARMGWAHHADPAFPLCAAAAMLFLAEQAIDGPPVPMGRIAEVANVLLRFLELILADLREAGSCCRIAARRGIPSDTAAHLISWAK